MDYVKQLYYEHLDRMTDAERFARTGELFEGVVAIIEHQIRSENPAIEERELRLRTAEILYLSDPGARHLLRFVREHGSA